MGIVSSNTLKKKSIINQPDKQATDSKHSANKAAVTEKKNTKEELPQGSLQLQEQKPSQHQFNVKSDSLLVDGEACNGAVSSAGGSSQNFPAKRKNIACQPRKTVRAYCI